MKAHIELKDAQIERAMHAAILRELDQKSRDDIIQQAIVYLLSPQESRIDGKPMESPLRLAFNRAAVGVMEELIQAEVKKADSKFRAIITGVIQKGIEEFILGHEKEKNQMACKIAEAIEKAILPSRYY